MDWKLFLKPTAFKILVTLILYFLVEILVKFATVFLPFLITIFGYSIFLAESIFALLLTYLIACSLQLIKPRFLENEFFKPTVAKVIITAVIYISTIFLRGIVVKANSPTLNILEYFISPHYLLSMLIMNGRDVMTYTDIFLGFLQYILGFLYWYFLACVLVWVYGKIKNKPKDT